jgi:hypothetical protein
VLRAREAAEQADERAAMRAGAAAAEAAATALAAQLERARAEIALLMRSSSETSALLDSKSAELAEERSRAARVAEIAAAAEATRVVSSGLLADDRAWRDAGAAEDVAYEMAHAEAEKADLKRSLAAASAQLVRVLAVVELAAPRSVAHPAARRATARTPKRRDGAAAEVVNHTSAVRKRGSGSAGGAGARARRTERRRADRERHAAAPVAASTQ